MTRPTSLLPGSPLSGPSLVGEANKWFEALANRFAGTTPPPYFIEGMLWVDTSVTPPALMERRGTQWLPFGFGSFQRDPVIVNTDWDAVETEGVSFFTKDAAVAAPNAPTAGQAWCCWQFRRAGGAKMQIAMRSSADDLRLRTWNGTAWTTWKRLFGDHNLLGTVSQASGLPTGAVIESGSNANGFWTKWADGTMICRTPTAGLAVGVSSAAGAMFSTLTTVNWTYPQTFVAAPVPSGSFDTAGKVAWLMPDTPGVSSIGLRGGAAASYTSGVIHAQVTGRWF